MKFASLSASALMAAVLSFPVIAEDISSSITFVNATGQDVVEIHTAPSATDGWSENILVDGSLTVDGEFTATVAADTDHCFHDFRFTLADGSVVEEVEIDVCELDGTQFEIALVS
ncbi:hypothetical protein [Hyphobacterium sp.]|jgi:hypothetical protein|uniref:hypothetical protein n=1 Tax=Hyphobacterium sp. TaxID=2004662 RepID=UPI003BA95A63